MLEIPVGQLPSEKTILQCYDIIRNINTDKLELELISETVEFDPSRLEENDLKRAKEHQTTHLFGVLLKVELDASNYGHYPYEAAFDNKTFRISSLHDKMSGTPSTFIVAGACVI